MILYTNSRKIPFQIDDDDYEAVSQYIWNLNGGGYPMTHIRFRKPCKITLHLFLMGKAPDGLEWDHRNRDRTDNRRENFRAITHIENLLNSAFIRPPQSGVFGVRWLEKRKRWAAQMTVNGKGIFLGHFKVFEEAVAARRTAELQYRGFLMDTTLSGLKSST